MLAVTVVLTAYLWGRARAVFFWVDEGISIGISSHAFTSIPEILRQDGSPPLYSLLLHVWMAQFGSSEVATHLLSLGFAVATVPAALWAGWSLFGRRVGWVFAALIALNPFVSYFATETRMYSLLTLLSLLAAATFVHAFVLRHRRYVPVFSVLLALVLYTHNWGLFFGVGAGVAALVCVALAEARLQVFRDVALAFGATAIAYLPWLPTLLYQLDRTGVPFAQVPTPSQVRDDLIGLIGPREAVVALGLGAVLGLMTMLPRPLGRAARSTLAISLLPGITVALAWLISRQESVWHYRYLAVVLAPLVLVLAVGVARGGQVALAGLVVYGALTAPIGVPLNPTQKSDIKLVADHFGPQMQPGELVVTDFGRIPVLSLYMPPGLRYADATGLAADPARTDQRDGVERLRAADQQALLAPLVAAMPVGGQVLVACAPLSGLTISDTEYVRLIFERCNQAEEVLQATPGLRLVDQLDPDLRRSTIHAAVQGRLYAKDLPT
jgi:hypothetical protein